MKKLGVSYGAVPGEACRTTTAARGAPEFFGILPLVAVGLFALNNGVLKRAYPGWVAGKLSDVLLCFFLPLFVSALLARICRLAPATRVAAGIGLTAASLVAVKTSVVASGVLNAGIAALARPLDIHLAPNRVDVSDLWALPVLALAWLYARRRADPVNRLGDLGRNPP